MLKGIIQENDKKLQSEALYRGYLFSYIVFASFNILTTKDL
jgi:hypothetical protein